MPIPTDATQSKPFTMDRGIELSAEQASWLAGELSK